MAEGVSPRPQGREQEMRNTPANDYRERPAYTVAEAARYLKLPANTLRSWVAGRSYATANGGSRRWPPLIKPASRKPELLSFWNLIEAYVLWGLRVDHSVSIKAVRTALSYAEKELQISRLLLRKELCTAAGAVFLERYGELIQLSASGQMALKDMFVSRLSRVDWDEWQFPVRLYPQVGRDAVQPLQPIAIDPGIAFGRPIIRDRGIRTEILAERIDVGETLEAVAADYDMTVEEVRVAILYEHAA